MQYENFLTEAEAKECIEAMQKLGYFGYVLRYNANDYQARYWK